MAIQQILEHEDLRALDEARAEQPELLIDQFLPRYDLAIVIVRQGTPERLEHTLIAALNRAQWCSSDPVCIESTGQGVDNANLAACHGCVLLPETSCEEGNRLLDRGMIVGTLGAPGLGVFTRG